MGKQQSQIRTSQTMPQLYYTREDIQEQYLGTAKARKQQQQQDNKSSKRSFLTSNKQIASSSKRARSSDPKQLAKGLEDSPASSASSSSGEDDAENLEGSAAAAADGKRGRRPFRSAGRKRRRRRRAHSASLFSACFQIPNIGSMLPSAAGNSQSSSHRRSFLSHLGLGGHQTNSANKQHHQTRLTTSQTLGNLQQVAGDVTTAGNDVGQQYSNVPRQGNSSSNNSTQARKHVSFGGHQQAKQQQQQINQDQVAGPSGQQANIATSIPMSPSSSSAGSMALPATFRQPQSRSANLNKLEQQQQQQQPRANNVIMRNYQASQHHQKQQQQPMIAQEVAGKWHSRVLMRRRRHLEASVRLCVLYGTSQPG